MIASKRIQNQVFRKSDPKFGILDFWIPCFVLLLETFYFDRFCQLDRVNQSEILWNVFKKRSVCMYQVQTSFIFTFIRAWQKFWTFSRHLTVNFNSSNSVLCQAWFCLWNYLNSKLACHFHRRYIKRTFWAFKIMLWSPTRISQELVIGQSLWRNRNPPLRRLIHNMR